MLPIAARVHGPVLLVPLLVCCGGHQHSPAVSSTLSAAEAPVPIVERSFVVGETPEGWVRSFGGPGDDQLRRLSVGADGAIFLAGHFEEMVDLDPGPEEDTRVCSGGIDIFLVKLSAEGDYLWGHTFGGPGMDHGLGLAVAPDGAVILSGAFEEIIDVDPGAGVDGRQSAGAADALIVRLDEAGSLVWARTYGGPNNEYATGIAVAPHGAIVVGGSFETGTDLDPGQGVDQIPNAGNLDMYVMALDAAGNRSWVRALGGGGMDIVETVGFVGDDIVAIGAFSESMDVDPGPARDERTSVGQGDGLVLRLGPTGDFQWALALGGQGEDIAGGLGVGPDGTIVVAGQFEGSMDIDPGPRESIRLSKSGVDMWVVSLSPSGGFRWGQTFGTEVADSSGTSVAFTSVGAIAVAGNGGVPLVYLSSSGGYLGSVELPRGVVVDGWGAWARPDGAIIWAGSFEGGAGGAAGPLPEAVTTNGGHDVFVTVLGNPPTP